MNAHTAIPFEIRLFSESFKLPSFGKFLSNLRKKIKDQYVFLNYAFMGFKEALIENKIPSNTLTESDIREFEKLIKLLSFVNSAIKDTDSINLLEIKTNVTETISSIDEIIKIIKDKLAYKQLKSNLSNSSIYALSNHLSKYNKAV